MHPNLSRPPTFFLVASALAVAGCTSSPMAASSAQAMPGGTLEHVDALRFRALAEQKGGLYLDVRTPGEVATGRIPGASTIDVTDAGFRRRFELLPRTRPIFVYCATGSRSAAVARILHQMGFAEVYDLQDGLFAWRRYGFPLEQAAGAAPGAPGLTPEAFDSLLRSERRLLVDYQAPWCEPCIRMAPMIEGVSQAWKGRARVVRVDVDQSQALASRERVEGVPMLVLYVDGKERWRHAGELPREAVEAELARP